MNLLLTINKKSSKLFGISSNSNKNGSLRACQYEKIKYTRFIETRTKITLACQKISINSTKIGSQLFLKRHSPLIISRSKSNLSLSLDKLPKVAKNPSSFDNLKRGPEWESTLGRIVRETQATYHHCVVLTRVGQFWEIYFEQATEIAPLLDIKLTRRKFGHEYFPFAGFPILHLDRHLAKLINEHGRAVALCDEFPNNNQNEEKVKFKRRVNRIITPGTLIDESFLQQDQNNFLLSISLGENHKETGLSWIDITTGQFYMQKSNLESLSNDISRIIPSEILISDTLRDLKDHHIWQHVDRGMNNVTFESLNSFDASRIHTLIPKQETERDIQKTFSLIELKASGGLLNYIKKNLIGRFPKIQFPIRIHSKDTMIIDATALRSLEITTSMQDFTKKGSLMHAIQRTKTASGTRTLDNWLRFPSTSINVINYRLNLVEYFYNNSHLTNDIRELLSECDDAQRTSQKVTFDQYSPDDFLKLKRTLEKMLLIKNRIRVELNITPNDSLESILTRFKPQQDLINSITKAVDEESLNRAKEKQLSDEVIEDGEKLLNPIKNDFKKETIIYGNRKTRQFHKYKKAEPTVKDKEAELQMLIKSDNWVINKDFSPQLIKLYKQLEDKYRDMINLQISWQYILNGPSLELRSHSSYGFIVIIRKSRNVNVEGLLKAIPITTIGNKKLYIIKQWSELGGEIENIKTKIREEENNVFQIIRRKIEEEWHVTIGNSNVIDDYSHKIIGGRHPIVESSLQKKGHQFVKNDCFVGDKERLLLITGPNMGGKSTYLRQNAVISILAQIGSFVPADYAEIGIVDQILSRNATQRSFVIMDEIGRGTTTLDGIAISFATLFRLHYVNRCRTLFATHFHEIPTLIKNFENAVCYCTDIQENMDGSFYYLHQLKGGVNRNSAALKAAQLAVLLVAKNTLDYLKKHSNPISLDTDFQNEIENNTYIDLMRNEFENYKQIE
ncbi:9502_t:CDS:10 [Diversispora eburnea]|uniref:9502_t:CDS:1 n=1 Tax=Diversispora eburnea TaxID=1213867 RepID=A0A9N8V4B4_9GLOM|nr:9502_t:CDS:10 [Diversispora eburnea]